MQPHEIYNLSVDTSVSRPRSRRVGLLEGRTGIPIFVLYLRGVSVERRLEIHSARDVESQVFDAGNSFDKEAWESLLPFFEAEGNSAHVVALPLCSSSANPISEMLGEDRGIGFRSGIHALLNFSEIADIAVVPQASLLLNGENHRLFYERLCQVLSVFPHFFTLIDFPNEFDGAKVQSWLRGMIYPDAAVYYPWLLRRERPIAPAVVAAAGFQRNDEEYGIFHLPANQTLKGNFRPLRKMAPSELMDCLHRRINTFHTFAPGDTRMWGGYTLADRLDSDFRFIATRRTIVAVQEAIHKVCEPFVLEPLSGGLENVIDVALQSAFQPFEKMFSSGGKGAFETQVQIIEERGQDIVQINVACRVPYQLGEMKFSLGLST